MYFPPEGFFGPAEAGLLSAATAPMMAGNETVRSAQVSVLQETFYPRSAESSASAALQQSGVSADAKYGGGPPVARPIRKPRLLEWAGKCGPRAGVAKGASELLEETQKTGSSLTSRLRGESRCLGAR